MFLRILSGLIILLLLFIGFQIFSAGRTGVSLPTLPIPTVFNPFPYEKPAIPVKRSYLTMLVGDSIIGSLGENANQLRLELISLYPTHEFVNYNYGFGSTNILSVKERLTKETLYQGKTYPPILSQGFDLIIIESFGYNPLSGPSLSESLKKYEETLNDVVIEIIKSHPNSVIAIMTPIAPNRENFAKGVYDLSPEVRIQWAKEREEYIKTAIKFAQERNIPLINVYERSLDANGNADLKYINPNDYIHPSKEGVVLITKTIAEFIYQNRIFPD